MSFNSLLFLIVFLPLFYLVLFLVPSKYKRFVLLMFSIFFYAYSGLFNLFLLFFLTSLNYVFAIIINKRKSNKIYFSIILLIDILSLSFFKYNSNILLPLGISFYIFNNIMYICDVYNKKIQYEKNYLNYLIYSMLFIHISMGPIVKYDVISSKLNNLFSSKERLYFGYRRFVIGLSKKVLIGDNLGLLYSELLLSRNNFYTCVLSIIVFGLQLYIDFSSYSDMAIGLGYSIGFDYSENFNYPYTALSISDFWRRWHISLSNFFKEYVYIPLGGNRVSVLRNIFNIMVVWILTGIWHGRSINFVLWGIYYGIIIILEKHCFNKFIKKSSNVFKHIYVLLIVFVGYIFFSISDLSAIKTFFISFLNFDFNNSFIFYIKENLILLILSLLMCFNIKDKLLNNKIINPVINILLICLYVVSICYIVSGNFSPFLYRGF